MEGKEKFEKIIRGALLKNLRKAVSETDLTSFNIIINYGGRPDEIVENSNENMESLMHLAIAKSNFLKIVIFSIFIVFRFI